MHAFKSLTHQRQYSQLHNVVSLLAAAVLCLAALCPTAALAQGQPKRPVFMPPVTFSTHPEEGAGPWGLVIAELVDLEGTGDDGYPDVAVVNAATPYESVSVFHNTGDWSDPDNALTLLAPFTLSSQPYDVKAADFDGDQDLDLAVTWPYVDKVAILENLGNGQFQMSETIELDTDYPQGLVVADLNLNGKQDIAVASTDTEDDEPKVEVLWKQSDGSWTHQVINMPPEVKGQGTEIVAGSVAKKPQSPALLDLVLGTYGQPAYLATLVNRGNGQFDVVPTQTGIPTSGIALGHFRAGVILPDLVLSDHPAMDRAQVYWNNAYGEWDWNDRYLLDLPPGLYDLGGVATGRINPDTKIDFVLTVNGYPSYPGGDPTCIDGIIVFVGYGDGTFVETPYFFYVDDAGSCRDPYFVKVADMDQDGFNDLLTSNSGASSISVLINAFDAIPPGGSP